MAFSASSSAQTLSDGCYYTSTVIYGGTFNSFSSMGTPTPQSPPQSPSGSSTPSIAVSPVASSSSSSLSSTTTSTVTTTTSSTPSPIPFYIEVNDGTPKARRAIRYVGFQGDTSVLVDNKADAALFILTADGYLLSGGEYVGTAGGSTGVLQKSQSPPAEPFPWTFNGASVFFGDSQFCYLANGDFVVYDVDQPEGCSPVAAGIEVASQTTSSTSEMSNTGVQTTTTTNPTTTAGAATTTSPPPSNPPSQPPGTSPASLPPGTSSSIPQAPGTSPSTALGLSSTSRLSSSSSVPPVSSILPPQSSSPLASSSPSSSLTAASSTARISSAPSSNALSTSVASSTGAPFTSSSRSSSASSLALSSSSSSAGVSSSTTRSSSTAPTTGTSSSSIVLSVSTTSSTSSTSSSTATPSIIPLTGKRGLAYTNVNTTVYYPPPTQVSWAYNYYSLPNRSTNNVGPYPYTNQYPLKFYPLLFNDNSGLTSVWSANVNYSIANYGTDAIFSFNEPDACFGGLSSCMTVSAALAAYKTFIQPFAGRVLLGAPAVTNAGSGFTWLSQFLGNATLQNLTVDFINIHWYASPYNMQYFMDYMAQAQQTAAAAGYPNCPVWITEYGMDNANYAEAAVLQFLRNTTYWVDIQPNSFIAKTCWFGNFANNLLNANGTGRGTRGDIWNNPSTGYVYGFSKRDEAGKEALGEPVDGLERRQMTMVKGGVEYYERRAAEADGGGELDGWALVEDDQEEEESGPEEVEDEMRGKWNWKDVETGIDAEWLKIVRGET